MPSKPKFSEALEYHEKPRPGKIEVRATKPTATQSDLSLAYTPGVADPCLVIADDPNAAFRYTNRGNLVAVVSNGSAVLGLGNIGARAAEAIPALEQLIASEKDERVIDDAREALLKIRGKSGKHD